MMILCYCEGYSETMMSEIDAVKVIVRSPIAMLFVIICLLGIMMFGMTMMMAVFAPKRTLRKSCVTEEGNKIFQAPRILNLKLCTLPINICQTVRGLFFFSFVRFTNASTKKNKISVFVKSIIILFSN